jgi:hypothetical protein
MTDDGVCWVPVNNCLRKKKLVRLYMDGVVAVFPGAFPAFVSLEVLDDVFLFQYDKKV